MDVVVDEAEVLLTAEDAARMEVVDGAGGEMTSIEVSIWVDMTVVCWAREKTEEVVRVELPVNSPE